MELEQLPEGVKPIPPAQEREIAKEWGPLQEHPPTGEGDIRMVKTRRPLDGYMVQALIGDKWRTLTYGQRRGVRGHVHFDWGTAERNLVSLRKHVHPAEYVAGLQASVSRMADLHRRMGEQWAAEVQADRNSLEQPDEQ